MPYTPPGYSVFRDVTAFGAAKDGSADAAPFINAAIKAGGRCGAKCNATSTLGAVIYFPAGTYRLDSPIIQYYYTTFVGDPQSRPILKGSKSFKGIALIDTDPYIPGGNVRQFCPHLFELRTLLS
jgi:glucan 1,3-beta-glucosidase